MLIGAGSVHAQQWDQWRRGYERPVPRTTASPRGAAAASPRVTAADTNREVDDSPLPATRELDRQTWKESDFDRFWDDSQRPDRKARNKISSEGYRDRRDPYSESANKPRSETTTDYRNPYKDYDDPDADGYGDSNRFNNDSDYLSPAELNYKSRIRPVFYGKERYDEREQRWDDETMSRRQSPGAGRSPVTIEHGDMSRWR
jgi:hypothetical protein